MPALSKRNLQVHAPKKCWLLHKEESHDPAQINKEIFDISCYVCKPKFRTRNGMMKHRVQYHIEVVPECREFMKGKCDFTGKENTCWFKHTENSQDFYKVADNLAPPAKK